MGDYVAFEGPAWLWILACFLLFTPGLVIGALACHVLGVASRKEIRALGERIRKLEAPEPFPVRYEPPDTILEASREIGEQRDTRPCSPWHTSPRL